MLKILYLVESIASRIQEAVVYKDWELALKISYATIDQICVYYAEQGVYEALREIEYKDWELIFKISYSKRLELTSITPHKPFD